MDERLNKFEESQKVFCKNYSQLNTFFENIYGSKYGTQRRLGSAIRGMGAEAVISLIENQNEILFAEFDAFIGLYPKELQKPFLKKLAFYTLHAVSTVEPTRQAIHFAENHTIPWLLSHFKSVSEIENLLEEAIALVEDPSVIQKPAIGMILHEIIRLHHHLDISPELLAKAYDIINDSDIDMVHTSRKSYTNNTIIEVLPDELAQSLDNKPIVDASTCTQTFFSYVENTEEKPSLDNDVYLNL